MTLSPGVRLGPYEITAQIFYLAPDGTLMGAPVETTRDGASFVTGSSAVLVDGTSYFTGIANQLGRTYDVSADGSRFLRIKVAQLAGSTEDAPPEIWFSTGRTS